ncbi:hypothetical protein Pla175_05490 [Pirellulimonas nuda]|uniref:Uncharacterized protein n=1 Tax=Pirellulimonas nuda TaxID=2528009 RepID=A0A518D6T2_9BACT|nr:hypothetical protein [Pirellulimonas nuda]QDU87192.1 hypothetical protein Pla175_05490 [Pirellulimonas nuda]
MKISQCYRLAEMVAPELKELFIGRHPEEWHTGYALAYARPCAGPRIAEHFDLADDQIPTILFAREPDAGLLLHELAHLLPVDGPESVAAAEAIEAGTYDDAGGSFDATGDDWLRAAVAWEGTFDLPPWDGHGILWIRRVLHLHHRAKLAGCVVDIEDLRVAGLDYQLAAPQVYAAALGDEPDRMANWTFAKVESVTPPTGYIDAFERDANNYFQRIKQSRG